MVKHPTLVMPGDQLVNYCHLELDMKLFHVHDTDARNPMHTTMRKRKDIGTEFYILERELTITPVT